MMGLLMLVSVTGNAQQWQSDLELAKTLARTDGKLVFLLFSVPDACDMCDELEKNVIKSETFRQFAAANYVLVRPDFRESAPFETKADNLLIVEKYNKDGFFPWVVILDANAKVLGKMGLYNDESPEMYIEKLQSIVKK